MPETWSPLTLTPHLESPVQFPLVLHMTSLKQKRPLLGMSLNEDAGGSFDMVVVLWSECERGQSDLGTYLI